MPPPIYSRYFTIFYDYMIAGVLGAPKRPNSSAHVSQQRYQLSQPQVHQRPYSSAHVTQQRHQLSQPQVHQQPYSDFFGRSKTFFISQRFAKLTRTLKPQKLLKL